MRNPSGLELILSSFVLAICLIPNSSHAAAGKDACKLFTPKDAQTAFGEPVDEATTHPDSINGSEGSTCKFRSTQGVGIHNKNISVPVEYSSQGFAADTRRMIDALKSAGYQGVRQVSRVGDNAIWGTNSVMGTPLGELTVIKGKSTMIIILINGISDDAALDRAKDLARKILPKA